jgi:hypothetical protein
MNSQNLYRILQDSTRVFRKGELVEVRNVTRVNVTEVFGYDNISEAPKGDNFDEIDMIFVDIVVDKARARHYESDLKRILEGYPQPERLAEGLSYVEIAPNLGMEQEGAFRLMALGKTLGLWDILSAKTFGMDDKRALEFASRGFLMTSGYNGGRI